MNRRSIGVQPLTVVFAIVMVTIFLFQGCSSHEQQSFEERDSLSVTPAALFTPKQVWTAPDTNSIPRDEQGKLILYGRTLLIHTSKYFGPNGIVSKSSNGMNCQSCHLDAGTRPYGNNLAAAASTYPKFSPRANKMISLADKVNECFSRSLNGTAIDTASKEMQAYLAYIKWLGKDIKKGHVFAGNGGIEAPPFINRAADPERGRLVYAQLCVRCHGPDGKGQLAVDVLKDAAKQQGGTATAEDLFYYPPLWGSQSYNGVATLYRVSKLAGFVKNNMPYPMTYLNPALTDEQAWDVAAYINSRERPTKDFSSDYITDLSKKPFDFPFLPYADTFSEAQHKFGPYTEMASAKKGH
jgi:thiosulfate dehydrogenase